MFARVPYLGSTAMALRSLILPAAVAHSAYCAYSAQQESEDAKHHIAHLASTTSAYVISHEAYSLICMLIGTGTWEKLTIGQRIAVGVIAAAGVAGSSYSMVAFGVQDQALVAGLSAAAGALALNVASTTSLLFAHKRLPYDNVSEKAVNLDEENVYGNEQRM